MKKILFILLILNFFLLKIFPTDIWDAADKSDFDQIKLFIEKIGFNINTKNENNGKSLLHYSVINNNLEISEYLLSKNININIKDNDNFPVIYYAVSKGYYDIVHLLLKYNPDINFNIEEYDNYDVTEFLQDLFLGSRNYEKKDRKIITKFFDFVIYKWANNKNDNYAQFSKILLEIYDYNVKLKNNVVYNKIKDIDLAILLKYNEIAKNIIKQGFLPDEKALISAIISNNNGILLYFNELKIINNDILTKAKQFALDNNYNNDSTRTINDFLLIQNPIFLSIKNNDKNQLINLISEQNINDYVEGMTPLFYSIQLNNTDIARLLIDKGANINLRNDLNESPLIISVKKMNTDIIKLLLDKNANYKDKDNDGLSAIDYSNQLKNNEIIKLFSDKIEFDKKQEEIDKNRKDELYKKNKTGIDSIDNEIKYLNDQNERFDYYIQNNYTKLGNGALIGFLVAGYSVGVVGVILDFIGLSFYLQNLTNNNYMSYDYSFTLSGQNLNTFLYVGAGLAGGGFFTGVLFTIILASKIYYYSKFIYKKKDLNNEKIKELKKEKESLLTFWQIDSNFKDIILSYNLRF